MPFVSQAQRRWGHTAAGIKALGGKSHVAEWDRATKGRKLPARAKSKKKAKFVINNKLRGYGRMDTKTNVIEINKKKHKGDKRELADTIKHELYHVKHPKAHEKTVYKKTGNPATMSHAEQQKMIAKLRMKKLNYKVGAAKRRFKMKKHEKVEPGSLISKMNTTNDTRPTRLPKNPAERTAIMGAV